MGFLKLNSFLLKERRMLIDFNGRLYNQIAFDIAPWHGVADSGVRGGHQKSS